MGVYREVLGIPGVARIIAAQLVARIPAGMLAVGYLLHIQQRTGWYGAAGVALAATSVGQAISGPLTSRAMSRFGMRPVLALTMVVCNIALAGIAVVPTGLSTPVTLTLYIGLAAVVGLAYPPVQSAVRTIYPKLVPVHGLRAVFSLDASLQEVCWIIGPMLTAVIATQIGTPFGLLGAVVIGIGGGLWFLCSPELGRVKIPRPIRRFGAVMLRPPVWIATLSGFLLVGAAASIETAVVALYGGHSVIPGVLFTIWAASSLVGGLAFGHRPVGPWSLAIHLGITAVGMSTVGIFPNFAWMVIALIIGGLGFAPAITAQYTIVAGSVKFAETAEANGWLGTGQLVGAALGAAVAGTLIDRVGPAGGFITSAAFVTLGFVVALITARWIPDLRRSDALAHLHTSPIDTIAGV